MRAGNRLATQCVNAETEEVYAGFRVTISGAMWECSQFCVLGYKRAPQPGFKEWPSGSRSYRFTRSAAPGGQCVRFAVDAITTLPLPNNAGFIQRRAPDRHFLAEDYTILG